MSREPARSERPARVRAERSDSLQNRDALRAAAQHVMSREGLEVPLERIAARAELSIATLYRHFPSREALWQAVLHDPLTEVSELLDRCLDDPDPWNGFSTYLWESCELEANADGYLNLMNTRFDGAPELMRLRTLIHDKTSRVFDRAHDAGAIRPDLTMEDLAFITLANTRILEATGDVAPTAWRRNLELFLDSIHGIRDHPLDEPPMKPAQLRRIMKQLRTSVAQPARGRPPRRPSEA